MAKPVVNRDYTRERLPLRLDTGAVLLDNQGGILSGSAPLRVRVIDPFGGVRYDLYRATDRGLFNLSLPLAINDPEGEWKVVVAELISNTEDTAAFTLAPAPICAAAAGATGRGVFLPEDRQNVFRFFRLHPQATIVKGKSDFNAAAATRLEKILKPWNITCSVVEAATVNRPRTLSEDEAATWVGLVYAGSGQIKPGEANPPAQAGFAVSGPVILLGTPEDNPLIQFLADQHFLPYPPGPSSMPGPARGYIAWQREGIGVNQESVTLLAYDSAGMDEAVGTLYEMVAGLQPLTPLVPPRSSVIQPAGKPRASPDFVADWSMVLDDRVTGIKRTGDHLSVLTRAGTVAEVQKDGLVASQQVREGMDYPKLIEAFSPAAEVEPLAQARRMAPPGRLVKYARASGDLLAVVYWGGTVHLYDQAGGIRASRRGPQDITAALWTGASLVVGDADGRLTSLRAP